MDKEKDEEKENLNTSKCEINIQKNFKTEKLKK